MLIMIVSIVVAMHTVIPYNSVDADRNTTVVASRKIAIMDFDYNTSMIQSHSTATPHDHDWHLHY